MWAGYLGGCLREGKTCYLRGWLEGAALIGLLSGHMHLDRRLHGWVKNKRLTTWEAGLKESRLAPAMFVDMAPGMARLPAIFEFSLLIGRFWVKDRQLH
jgi:hypothetical protein